MTNDAPRAAWARSAGLVEVGGVVQRAVGPQRAEGGEVGDAPAPSRRPPSPRRGAARAPCRRSARSSGGPAAAARRARACPPRRAPCAAARTRAPGGPSASRTAGRRGGRDGAAARAVVVGALHDGADAHEVEQRPQLAGQRALLADERVGRPLQVDRAQVGERDDEAHRHGPVGQRRQDRVVGPAPVVEGEELAGQDHGAPAARQRAVEVVGGVAPRRGHAVRAARAGGRGRRRAPAASTRAPPAPPRRRAPAARRRGRSAQHGQRAEAREPERHQRPRLVGRAQEAHGLHVVVGEGRRAAQRRPLGEADEHHEQAEEHQREEERRVARAPRPRERPQAQRGDARASRATTGASPR